MPSRIIRGTNRIITTVTGVIGTDLFDVIIPAASGYTYEITQITAVNQENSLRAISFYDGWDKLYSSIPLGASGTLLLGQKDLGGDDGIRLTTSSGMRGAIDITGSVEVGVYYVTYDNRTPINKFTARRNTLNNVTIIRAPNRFGNQQES